MCNKDLIHSIFLKSLCNCSVLAICNPGCLNGGECVAPNVCACRRGYVGPSCELDLDECALDMDQCSRRAECVNMPGWYYCRCRKGYHSYRHDTNLGLLCQGKNNIQH